MQGILGITRVPLDFRGYVVSVAVCVSPDDPGPHGGVGRPLLLYRLLQAAVDVPQGPDSDESSRDVTSGLRVNGSDSFNNASSSSQTKQSNEPLERPLGLYLSERGAPLQSNRRICVSLIGYVPIGHVPVYIVDGG